MRAVKEMLMMLRIICAGVLALLACGCSNTTVQEKERDPNRPEREKVIVRPEKRDGDHPGERPPDR
jgi:hypothetical protein